MFCHCVNSDQLHNSKNKQKKNTQSVYTPSLQITIIIFNTSLLSSCWLDIHFWNHGWSCFFNTACQVKTVKFICRNSVLFYIQLYLAVWKEKKGTKCWMLLLHSTESHCAFVLLSIESNWKNLIKAPCLVFTVDH